MQHVSGINLAFTLLITLQVRQKLVRQSLVLGAAKTEVAVAALEKARFCLEVNSLLFSRQPKPPDRKWKM